MQEHFGWQCEQRRLGRRTLIDDERTSGMKTYDMSECTHFGTCICHTREEERVRLEESVRHCEVKGVCVSVACTYMRISVSYVVDLVVVVVR